MRATRTRPTGARRQANATLTLRDDTQTAGLPENYADWPRPREDARWACRRCATEGPLLPRGRRRPRRGERRHGRQGHHAARLWHPARCLGSVPSPTGSFLPRSLEAERGGTRKVFPGTREPKTLRRAARRPQTHRRIDVPKMAISVDDVVSCVKLLADWKGSSRC